MQLMRAQSASWEARAAHTRLSSHPINKKETENSTAQARRRTGQRQFSGIRELAPSGQ
jgi:hypothetical protein